jgi:undecaprenyl-diphosphatase
LDTSTSDRSSVGRTVSRSAFAERAHQRIEALQRLELRIVGAQRRLSDLLPLRALARAANWLGDGWLYVVLAAGLLVDARRGLPVLASAAIAVELAHAVYPWIKSRVARPRPFERSPLLQPYIRVLDRYSFPSGHCMTATAAAMPFAQGYPDLAWLAATVWAVIAWARMACAHHYPTDLLAGAALGLAAAFVGAELQLAVPVLLAIG